MELMTLRTMCERLNVSRRSIQCYEQAGLLKPSAKNKYGHLLYDEQAFQRAQMIRFLQQLGFKLEEVKEIIDAPDNVRKDAMEVHVRMLECETEKMTELIQRARVYINSINGKSENGGKTNEK